MAAKVLHLGFLFLARFADASAKHSLGPRAPRPCPPGKATCKRGDFTGTHCVPLEIGADVPITFKNNKSTLYFPPVTTGSAHLCADHLNRFAWTTSEPTGAGVKFRRTDWVAGSCNCSSAADDTETRAQRLRGAAACDLMKGCMDGSSEISIFNEASARLKNDSGEDFSYLTLLPASFGQWVRG